MTDAVYLDDSNYIIGVNNTTPRLYPPPGKSEAVFHPGLISETSNPLPDFDLAAFGYSEMEWSLSLGDVSSEVLNSDIEFRVTREGEVLEDYLFYPRIRCRIPFQGSHNQVSPLGVDSTHVQLTPIVDSQVFRILFGYGTFGTSIQAILNAVRGSLEGIVCGNIHSIQNKLLVNDQIVGNLSLKNGVSEYLLGIKSFLLAISEGTGNSTVLLNTVCGGEIQAIQGLLSVIEGKNILSNYQFMKNALGGIEVTQITSPYFSIFLDGINIQNLIGGDIVLSFNQDSVHNEVTLNSISDVLFDLCDPSIRAGEDRLEIHIGSRVLFFLVETRSGSAENLTVWGRDKTAKENVPWSKTQLVKITEPVLVSEVVSDVVVTCPVTWNTYDWVIPLKFELEGTAIDILTGFASEIGAVVRAQDDGSLLVRKKNTVRPSELSTATIEAFYYPSDIYDLLYSKTQGDLYSEVLVQRGSDVFIPTIEVESKSDGSGYAEGETAFVRVFWAGTVPYVSDIYATAGVISQVMGPEVNGGFKEQYEEIVEFKEGIGETQYSMSSLDEVIWIGDSGSIVPVEKHSKSIILDDLTVFRIAKVKYTTEFGRYEVKDHDVETLMAVFFLDVLEEDILVYTDPVAKDSDGNIFAKRGNPISSAILTEETGLVLKGESWIDGNKYTHYDHSFSTPYRDDAKDGQIIWLDGKRVGSPGIYLVTEVTTTIKRASVIYNTLRVIQWEI